MTSPFHRGPRTRSHRSLLVVVVLLVLLPVLIFSAYELAGLSSSESIMVSTYNRQLEGILSSVNQYAWDVVSGWTLSLGRSMENAGDADSVLATFLGSHDPLEGIFVADTTGHLQALAAHGQTAPLRGKLLAALENIRPRLEQLLRLKEVQYTKLESYALENDGRRVVLLFVMRTAPAEQPKVAGFVVDPEHFVRALLGPRLRETAGTEFMVAVMRREGGEVVFSTDSVAAGTMTQRRSLWIFPRLEAGIRFRGVSPEELASSRSVKTIALIILLNLTLIAGVTLLYRNMRRESEFTRQKSDFVSNVSHELRTPLALIRMYAETLEMGRGKGKEREYYSTIVGETARLTRLVNNILNFSRMEAGRMPYRFEAVDLNEAVDNVLHLWDGQLKEECVETARALAEDLPLVQADAEAVTEALINLVDNALKYGGEKKYLRVSTALEGDWVAVRVEDHGIGIGHQHLKRVFDMFYRASGGLVQGARGSGVGLAIVRHIMDAHHGTVKVTSVPGSGSTFTLLFPVKRERGPGPHPSTAS